MRNNSKLFAIALCLLLAQVSLNVWSQEQQTPADRPNNAQNVLRQPEEIPVAEMPITWCIMGQEFWYSNRFNMSEALSGARSHYRRGQLNAAQAQINEAISWLGLAAANSDRKSRAELQSVITNLADVSSRLNGEKSVLANELNQAFANANLALAKHHSFTARKLTQQADMLNAGRRLIAAADHMKSAANAADIAPSPIVGTFRSQYSPYGMVDLDSFEPTPQQLKLDLDELSQELKKLGEQLDQKSN